MSVSRLESSHPFSLLAPGGSLRRLRGYSESIYIRRSDTGGARFWVDAHAHRFRTYRLDGARVLGDRIAQQMTDTLTQKARSALMSRVRNKDTAPEVAVRKALHAAGFRFRLHRKDLPGRPDILLPRYRMAVFVHGCFWHGHDCRRGRLPSSNLQFWEEKIGRNRERDRLSDQALAASGWSSTTIWACSIAADTNALIEGLKLMRDPTERAR